MYENLVTAFSSNAENVAGAGVGAGVAETKSGDESKQEEDHRKLAEAVTLKMFLPQKEEKFLLEKNGTKSALSLVQIAAEQFEKELKNKTFDLTEIEEGHAKFSQTLTAIGNNRLGKELYEKLTRKGGEAAQNLVSNFIKWSLLQKEKERKNKILEMSQILKE